jgi:hypothetical protein
MHLATNYNLYLEYDNQNHPSMMFPKNEENQIPNFAHYHKTFKIASSYHMRFRFCEFLHLALNFKTFK